MERSKEQSLIYCAHSRQKNRAGKLDTQENWALTSLPPSETADAHQQNPEDSHQYSQI